MSSEVKTIHVTDHARDRMKKRRVTEKMVESVIRTPALIGPGNTDDTRRYERDFPPAKRLVVIAEEHEDCFNIITTYWI